MLRVVDVEAVDTISFEPFYQRKTRLLDM